MSPVPPAGHYLDGSNTAFIVFHWEEVEAVHENESKFLGKLFIYA